MITREEATEIALIYVKVESLGVGVSKTLLPEEITFRPPMFYDSTLDNTWVAYVEIAQHVGLCSSTIIVIDRSNGEIRYSGSAYDEG